MLEIVKSVVKQTLSSRDLEFCKNENHLRGLFISSFFESGLGAGYLCLVEQEDRYSRLDSGRKRKMRDVAITTKQNPELEKAVGEFKFFHSSARKNFRLPIAARLSDLHYVQDYAAVYKIPTFFLDVTFQPELVNQECYESLWEMSQEVTRLIFSERTPIEKLARSKGLKAYFATAIDHTSRARHRKYYGNYLFPCIDAIHNGHPLRGPVLVRKQDKQTGLISIGVRRPKTKLVDKQEQVTDYLPLPNCKGAVCFAAFDAGGKMEFTTTDVVQV